VVAANIRVTIQRVKSANVVFQVMFGGSGPTPRYYRNVNDIAKLTCVDTVA